MSLLACVDKMPVLASRSGQLSENCCLIGCNSLSAAAVSLCLALLHSQPALKLALEPAQGGHAVRMCTAWYRQELFSSSIPYGEVKNVYRGSYYLAYQL